MDNMQRVNGIIKYIESKLTEELTIDDIAGTFYMNPKYLMRIFKKSTGLTIVQYVNNKKISTSIDSLINTDNKILKIALDNGFNSLEYYSETFYKVVGISPNKFRSEYKDELYNEKEKLLKLKQNILSSKQGKILSLNRKKK